MRTEKESVYVLSPTLPKKRKDDVRCKLHFTTHMQPRSPHLRDILERLLKDIDTFSKMSKRVRINFLIFSRGILQHQNDFVSTAYTQRHKTFNPFIHSLFLQAL